VSAGMLLPALSGALVWPWLFLTLRDLRRSASR
jgi:cell shape-determining protein MreD